MPNRNFITLSFIEIVIGLGSSQLKHELQAENEEKGMCYSDLDFMVDFLWDCFVLAH